MTNEAFWETTPRQFVALVDRYREAQKQQDRRAGGIIAMLYNIHRDSDKDPNGLDWYDFFPDWAEATEKSEEEMIEIMKLWSAATQRIGEA